MKRNSLRVFCKYRQKYLLFELPFPNELTVKVHMYQVPNLTCFQIFLNFDTVNLYLYVFLVWLCCLKTLPCK